MKPNFALNITDTALELLRRTSRGWMLVGEAAFDSPDLDEAVSYLRASALGLSPHGITTKLIIPRSQILYTEVYAPGPDAAARRAAVAAALEGMTPYQVKDLVFDFRGTGDIVKVAAVARETLQEAEVFAQGHRLNPVSFVTTPDAGQFAGEPWFGQTETAEKILPKGEKVTRDQDPVNIVGRDVLAEEADAAAKAAAEKAAALSAEKALAEEKAREAAKAEAEKAVAAQQERDAEKAALEIAKAEAAGKADAARKADADKAKATVQKPAVPEVPAVLPKVEPEAEDAAATAVKLKLMEAEAKAILEANSEAQRKAAEAGKAVAARDAEKPAKPAAPADGAVPEGAVGDSAAKSGTSDTAPLHFSSRRRDTPPPPAAALGAAVQKAPSAAPSVETPVKSETANTDVPKAPQASVLTPAAPTGPAPKLAGAVPPKPAGPKPPVIDKIIATRAPAAEVGDKTISPATPPVDRPQTPASAKSGFAAMVTAASIPGRSGQPKRSKTKSTPDVPRPARSRGKPPARDEALGKFGRKLEPTRGKPRFLGLFLVTVLLVLMALVAAWSSYLVTWDDPADVPVVAEGQISPDLPAPQDPELLADLEPEAVADAALPEIAAPDAVDLPAVPVENTASQAEETLPAPDSVIADVAPATEEAAPVAEVADPAAEDLAPEPEVAATEPEPAPAEEEIQVAQPDVVPPVTTQDRSAPAIDRQDEIFLAATDGPPPVFDPVSLPVLTARSDAPPGIVAPPPPFGTFYEFDADGLIKPTPEGVITPEGVRLVAARPAILPPPRPAAISAPAVAAPEAPVADPVIAAAPAEPDSTIASAFSPDPEFSAPRPKARPADAAPETPGDDDASVTNGDSTTRLTSLRPLVRPQSVLARAAEAQSQAQGASLAAAAVAEPEGGAAASVLAVSYSPRPAARPRDFSSAVSAAVAAATRNSPAEESDEAHEPEVQVSASAAPRIPTQASVAKQATFSNAINLSKTNLIGVYGTANNRYALVRSSSGSFKKVKVGDKVDGGTVAAITSNELRYKKGSKLLTLSMPKG